MENQFIPEFEQYPIPDDGPNLDKDMLDEIRRLRPFAGSLPAAGSSDTDLSVEEIIAEVQDEQARQNPILPDSIRNPQLQLLEQQQLNTNTLRLNLFQEIQQALSEENRLKKELKDLKNELYHLKKVREEKNNEIKKIKNLKKKKPLPDKISGIERKLNPKGKKKGGNKSKSKKKKKNTKKKK